MTRTRYCLGTFGIVTTERTFAEAHGQRKAMRAISVSSAGSVAAIRHLIAWPDAPTPDWQKGFLAGIFDAEGGAAKGSSGSPIPIPRYQPHGRGTGVARFCL